MISKDTTFTVREIAEASGIPEKTISSRARRLREEGQLPQIPKRTTAFYTYEPVVKIIRKPKHVIIKIRPSHVDLLKRQLQNDGYKINKEPKKEATA